MADNKYLGLADEVFGTDGNQQPAQPGAQAGMYAAGVEPVRGESVEIARELNLPVGTVERNFDELSKVAKRRRIDYGKLATDAPLTNGWLADPVNASVAADDIDNLVGIEQAWDYLKKGASALGSGLPKFNEGIYGLGQAVTDTARTYVTGPLSKPIDTGLFDLQVLPEDPLAPVSDFFSDLRQGQKGLADSMMPKGDGSVEQGVYSGLQSLGQNLLTLPAAILSGNPSVALAPMIGGVGGSEYGRARDKGLDYSTAAIYATSQAAVEFATEKLPMGMLIKDLEKNTGFMSMLGRQLAAELPGEQIATLLQDLNEWAALNPDKPFSSYLAERPNAALQIAVATAIGTGGMVTVAKGIDAAAGRFDARAAKAAKAVEARKAFEQLNNLVNQAKVKQTSPSTMKAFADHVAQGGSLYVDARQLANALQQSGIDINQVAADIPSIGEQLQAKVAAGQHIKIPTSEFLTKVAGSNYAQVMLDHLKTDPNDLSQAEADEVAKGNNETAKAEVARIIKHKRDIDAHEASAEVVRKGLEEQLNTANRFSKDVNRTNAQLLASFFSAYSSHAGMTPEEMANLYQLRVTAETVGGHAGAVDVEPSKTLDDRLDDFIDERDRLRKEAGFTRGTQETPLTTALSAVSKAAFTEDEVLAAVDWAMNNGRPDIAQAGAERAERAAKSAAEQKPGVSPESPKYQLIVEDLAEIARAKAEFAAKLRQIAGPAANTLNQFLGELRAEPTGKIDPITKKPQFNVYDENGDLVNLTRVSASADEAVANTRAMLTKRAEQQSASAAPAVRLDEPTKEQRSNWKIYRGEVEQGADDDEFLYHITTYDNARNILRTGLVPDTGKMFGGAYSGYSSGRVFVTEKSGVNFWKERVQQQLEHQADKVPAVAVVRIPKNKIKADLKKDEVGTKDARADAFFSEGQTLYQTPVSLPETLDIDGVQRPTTNSNGKPIAQTEEGVRNFWHWFGDSQVVDEQGRPLVVYHGTTADIEAFDLSRAGQVGQRFADAAFFTTDTTVASGYAQRLDQNHDALVSAEAELRSEYGKAVVAQLSATNTTDGEIAGEVKRRYDAAVAARREHRRALFNNEIPTAGANIVPVYLRISTPVKVDASGGYFFQTHEQAFTEAENAGADGVVVRNVIDRANEFNNGVSDVFAVFNPEQIKSAVGNSGAFDPQNPNILNQAAYHGSPFKFDKFTLDHIGNGEGRQAFGWGLYFAGDRAVAEDYRKSVPYRQVVNSFLEAMPEDASFADVMDLIGTGTFGEDQERVMKALDADDWLGFDYPAQAISAAFKDVEAFDPSDELRQAIKSIGKLYKVDIPDNGYLLWDKKISDQPDDVRGTLAKLTNEFARDPVFRDRMVKDGMTGKALYESMVDFFLREHTDNPSEAQKIASKHLNEKGLNGIKFLDGNSRKAGEGSHNYVVFDDESIQILETLAQGDQNNQRPLAEISFANDITSTPTVITLLKGANLSSFIHESGHFFLEVLADISSRPNAPKVLQDDFNTVMESFGIGGKTPAPAKGMVRYYHGGNPEGVDGALWFTSELGDAKGWANRSPGMQVWYVDIPENDPVRGGDESFGVLPLSRVELPAEFASKRKVFAEGNANAREVWAGMTLEQKRPYHEQFARGFEVYAWEGKAPSLALSKLFQRFRAWMLDAYKKRLDAFNNKDLGKALDVKLSNEVRSVMDRMLATQEQIYEANLARGYMPAFETKAEAEAAGVDWEQYQADLEQANQDAITDLESRSLRDLRWFRNAHNKEVRRLRREAAALRREARIDARAEVLSHPIYQVMQFLNAPVDAIKAPKAKSDPNTVDPVRDSLLVAVAKLGGLQRDTAVDQFGLDPADFKKTPVFGKPILRRNGGLTPDGMAEALAQLGYMPAKFGGSWDMNDLGDYLHDEGRGIPHYSETFDYRNLEEQNAGLPDLEANPFVGGRIDRESMVREYGGSTEDFPWENLSKMISNDGIHPDVIADRFGFQSGDEMVRFLLEAKPLLSAIEDTTDRIMFERHGDLTSKEALDKAADEAIHNRMRAKVLATEANALAKTLGARGITAKAARIFAERILAGMRIIDIKPSHFAAEESKAAVRFDKARKKGNVNDQALEKRNQLVNNIATRLAYDAEEEVAKAVRHFKQLQKPGSQKSMRGEYLEQLNALLERFELRTGGNSRKAINKANTLPKFADWLQAKAEELGAPTPDMVAFVLDGGVKKPYRDMTLEEFRGLVDAVKQLEHLARREQKQYMAIRGMEFEQEKNAILDRLRQFHPDAFDADGNPKGQAPDFVPSLKQKLGKHANALLGEFLGNETIVNILEGGELGLLHESLFKRISDRSNWRTTRMEGIFKKLEPLFDQYSIAEKRAFSMKDIGGAIGIPITREKALGVALLVGNTEGRDRVRNYGWTDEQIIKIIDLLDERDKRLAEGIWDLFDNDLWPDLKALNERTAGKAPPKVEATPYTNRLGTWKGGYMRLKYDSDLDERAYKFDVEQSLTDMRNGMGMSSKTPQGTSIERKQGVLMRPRLDFNVFVETVTETVHDIAYREAVSDVIRLLNDKDIQAAIKQAGGVEVFRAMRRRVAEVAARPRDPFGFIEKFVSIARRNTIVTLMSGVGTAFQNLTGLIPAAGRVHPWLLAREVRRFYSTDMKKSYDFAVSQSEYMRHRFTTYEQDLINTAKKLTVNGSLMPDTATWLALMGWIDRGVSVPVWNAAFAEGMEKHANDNKMAVEYADHVVRQTQGSGRMVDKPGIMTGNPLKTAFTMFHSYFNSQLQQLVRAGLISAKEAKTNPRAAAGRVSLAFVVFWILPALVTEMFKRTPDDEDDEEKLARYLKGLALYPTAMFPIVRDVTPVLWDRLVSEDGWSRYYKMSPIESGAEGVIKGVESSADIVKGEGDQQDVKNLLMGVGFTFGVPGKLISDVVTGTYDFATGEAGPQAMIMGPEPKK